ncbi:FSR family fosmidomycin resistance protein-like MFS transporter [Pseudomonas sp. BIGb0408]|uniref:FSR family fosmidomycin resistance protein-like MFS transporter n=1 Tax=Phytopseudomonas flavescens TaxID=29435 RepID=A0A7Y9XP10_9GAMM|nr:MULTISPECIES: MFS transporter [Pseudomonas]MCW2291673.1 FSR family fosmidomycin resistance protein-like MFS transporter [Pseudomonas sp. BIGb0408]NYH73756.1 FSR family fosmidomycin resistance protein-like MFS transporter [Pseudomonas flavescens]
MPNTPAAATLQDRPAMPLLLLIGLTHLLNDMLQAVLPTLYPALKAEYGLSYGQLGLLTLVFHLVGALCQPLIGYWGDRRSRPWLLPSGMLCMAIGLWLLAQAESFAGLVWVAALVGLGSSIFHPEAARACRQVSAGRFGLAQSVFQLGGNIGSALAPLLIALVLLPAGAEGMAWLPVLALLGFILLVWARRGVSRYLGARLSMAAGEAPTLGIGRRRLLLAMALLSVMILSKYAYLAAMANYYSFYLIERFELSVADAQLQLFVFLAAVAVGTLMGGPLGDRIGHRWVILLSLLGSCPFTLLLPHVGFSTCVLLSVVIGVLMASAFPAIIVYAQQLLPNRVGLVAGYFFELTFGVSGIAAAALGLLADRWGIEALFMLVGWLPLLGLLALWLPAVRRA